MVGWIGVSTKIDGAISGGLFINSWYCNSTASCNSVHVGHLQMQIQKYTGCDSITEFIADKFKLCIQNILLWLESNDHDHESFQEMYRIFFNHKGFLLKKIS
jgi:hypothetical protein